ncbi:MAG: NifU family protein [Candidatus Anaerobiospirillum merdipullorum]|uniref:Fe/S biogenesis protein NfuA n=1 Tax=Candidatus Anaerobiospirillum merdipullorum TaxID=2838450 RepID=A0A9E2NS44_9GAMM|nr:NifU family protein [Candidatus Anaerobiospirillum merdipullorum]
MSSIKVTEPAQAYFRKIIAKQKMDGLAIRLTVTNPGTPGVECGILFCPKDYITPNDEHFKFEGFEIVIDKNVSEFLEASHIDMGTDDKGEEILTFHAPNLKKKVLPDDASLFDQVSHFLNNVVNPSLAGHGGAVELVEVTADNMVKVRFTGGCMGCSMVGATLHDGIEAQLNQAFPGMIKGVEDVTAHEVTADTYA